MNSFPEQGAIQSPELITSAEALLAPYEKMPADETGFVFIGPSGAGKSTLRDALVEQSDGYAKYYPLTTRPPRPGEIKEYRFVTPEVMNEASQSYNAVFGNTSYGNQFLTLWPEALPSGQKYLYIYLPDAALKLRETFPNTKIVQIIPGDMSSLADRIKLRDPNISQDELAKRVDDASTEIAKGSEIADAVVMNDGNIEDVATQLRTTLERLQ
jgi:guanylate kinase